MTTRSGNVVIGIYNKEFRRSSSLCTPGHPWTGMLLRKPPQGDGITSNTHGSCPGSPGVWGILSTDSVSKTITPPPFQPLFFSHYLRKCLDSLDTN